MGRPQIWDPPAQEFQKSPKTRPKTRPPKTLPKPVSPKPIGPKPAFGRVLGGFWATFWAAGFRPSPSLRIEYRSMYKRKTNIYKRKTNKMGGNPPKNFKTRPKFGRVLGDFWATFWAGGFPPKPISNFLLIALGTDEKLEWKTTVIQRPKRLLKFLTFFLLSSVDINRNSSWI